MQEKRTLLQDYAIKFQENRTPSTFCSQNARKENPFHIFALKFQEKKNPIKILFSKFQMAIHYPQKQDD